MVTKNEHGIRKNTDRGKEHAADDAGPENLEQEIAALRDVVGGEERDITVDDDQKKVAKHGGAAWQESIRLLTF